MVSLISESIGHLNFKQLGPLRQRFENRKKGLFGCAGWSPGKIRSHE